MNAVLRLVLTMFEGFVIGAYMDSCLEIKKEKYSKWFIGGIILSLVIVSHIEPLSAYKFLVINSAIALLGKLFYNEKLMKILVRIVIWYGVVFAVEWSVLFILTQNFNMTIEELISGRPIDFTLVGYICTSIVLVISRMLAKDNPIKKKVTWSYWTIIILSNVCTIILIFGIMAFNQEGQGLEEVVKILVAALLGLGILNGFHCYTYILLKVQYKKENEYALIKNVNEGQFKHMLQNQKSFGVVRKVKHDLNNQMIGLNYLLEKEKIEEARAYIQRISSTLEDAELKYVTGNSVVDTIINQKDQYCKEHQIELHYEVQQIATGRWSPQDICVVLGNALDNAIEASKEVEISKRHIFLKMFVRKGHVVCEVTNTYLATPKQRKLMTLKDKKWHGIGLKSIKETVHWYGGEIFIETKEDVFILKIVVPIEEFESIKE